MSDDCCDHPDAEQQIRAKALDCAIGLGNRLPAALYQHDLPAGLPDTAAEADAQNAAAGRLVRAEIDRALAIAERFAAYLTDATTVSDEDLAALAGGTDPAGTG